MIDPIAIGAILTVGGLLTLVGCVAGLAMMEETPVPCGLTLASASAFVGGVALSGGWSGVDGFILPLFVPVVLVGEYAAWWQGGDWWGSQ